MAQLSSTTITGTIKPGCTADCSKAGNIWYNTLTCKMQYSYCTGAGIAARNI